MPILVLQLPTSSSCSSCFSAQTVIRSSLCRTSNLTLILHSGNLCCCFQRIRSEIKKVKVDQSLSSLPSFSNTSETKWIGFFLKFTWSLYQSNYIVSGLVANLWSTKPPQLAMQNMSGCKKPCLCKADPSEFNKTVQGLFSWRRFKVIPTCSKSCCFKFNSCLSDYSCQLAHQ